MRSLWEKSSFLTKPLDFHCYRARDAAAVPPETLDRSLPESAPLLDIIEELLHSMQRVSVAAYAAFANKYGAKEALKRLVAGEVREMVFKHAPLIFSLPKHNNDNPFSFAELERLVYDLIPR